MMLNTGHLQNTLPTSLLEERLTTIFSEVKRTEEGFSFKDGDNKVELTFESESDVVTGSWFVIADSKMGNPDTYNRVRNILGVLNIEFKRQRDADIAFAFPRRYVQHHLDDLKRLTKND